MPLHGFVVAMQTAHKGVQVAQFKRHNLHLDLKGVNYIIPESFS